MDALERLQMQGRKIGVISHVAEMTERIPAQVQVCLLYTSLRIYGSVLNALTITGYKGIDPEAVSYTHLRQ